MSHRSRLRMLVLQVMVLALMGTAFGRLWYLQVRVGGQYQQAAVANQVRDIIAPAVEFVGRAFPKLRFLLTVCTGSALAAKAGVLDGKKATSNKAAFDWVGGQRTRCEGVSG